MKDAKEKPVQTCGTKYPILLVHGTSVTDRYFTRCWGRIPDRLRAAGAEVFFGRQDAWGGLHTNTLQLAESVDIALHISGAKKINLIAHSKGGLECRALTKLDGYADKIASITTISTPHRGIGFLSRLWPFLFWLAAIVSVLLYLPFRILYHDEHPNLYRLLYCMTRKACRVFNEQTPDLPQIYYQSYAGKLPSKNRNKLFAFSHRAEEQLEGENDGLIAVDSSKWGNFRGTFSGGGKRGVSHADEIDIFHRSFEGGEIIHNQNKTYTSVPELYVHIAANLKARGY